MSSERQRSSRLFAGPLVSVPTDLDPRWAKTRLGFWISDSLNPVASNVMAMATMWCAEDEHAIDTFHRPSLTHFGFNNDSGFKQAPKLAELDTTPNLQSDKSEAQHYMSEAASPIADIRSIYDPLQHAVDHWRNTEQAELALTGHFDPTWNTSLSLFSALNDGRYVATKKLLTGLAETYGEFSEAYKQATHPILRHTHLAIGDWEGLPADWTQTFTEEQKDYVHAVVARERDKYASAISTDWANFNFLKSVAGTLTEEQTNEQVMQVVVHDIIKSEAEETYAKLTDEQKALTWKDFLASVGRGREQEGSATPQPHIKQEPIWEL